MYSRTGRNRKVTRSDTTARPPRPDRPDPLRYSFRAHLRFRHLDVKVRMLMLVAGRILTTHHVQDIPFHLFRSPGGNIPFALLGNHVRDISFLGTKIIPHRLRLILLIALLKQRIAKLLPDRVESKLSEHDATIHIHLNQFGLQLDILVFDIAFPVKDMPSCQPSSR